MRPPCFRSADRHLCIQARSRLNCNRKTALEKTGEPVVIAMSCRPWWLIHCRCPTTSSHCFLSSYRC